MLVYSMVVCQGVKRRGMSLVEVMMAVAVISVAILGVLSAVAFGLRSAAYGQRVTEATNLARQISEIIRAQGLAWSTSTPWLNTGTITPATFNNPQFALNYDGGTGSFANLPATSVYRKSINITQVAPSGSFPFPYESYLYRVSVVVNFYERGSLRRVEMVSIARRPR